MNKPITPEQTLQHFAEEFKRRTTQMPPEFARVVEEHFWDMFESIPGTVCQFCGGVMLADTEDWPNPACYNCWVKMEANYGERG